MKPYSAACDRNREPILHILRNAFAGARAVLEIGSGTGQHAVFFGEQLPHLVWYPSDLAENHEGIRQWLAEAGLSNVMAPLSLDVDMEPWTVPAVDAAFTANTLHIVSWPRVERLFRGVAETLPTGGVFCSYGPFNYNGTYTSESNAQFDLWLKARDPESAIRDYEAVVDLGIRHGLELQKDHPMPANNRLLQWRKH